MQQSPYFCSVNHKKAPPSCEVSARIYALNSQGAYEIIHCLNEEIIEVHWRKVAKYMPFSYEKL